MPLLKGDNVPQFNKLLNMSHFFEIHPENPQNRMICQVVAMMRKGGVIAYPTDSSYALGCHIGDRQAMERLANIRRIDSNHNFTLVCRDLSEIATYAKVDNIAYRMIKALTPGPYTFILKATREVPRRLQNPKRKTIGLRVPNNAIVQSLLETIGEPIMSTTLILPQSEIPLTDPNEIQEQLGQLIEAVIDGGNCGIMPTTVIDLVGDEPVVIRQGLGATDFIDAS